MIARIKNELTETGIKIESIDFKDEDVVSIVTFDKETANLFNGILERGIWDSDLIRSTLVAKDGEKTLVLFGLKVVRVESMEDCFEINCLFEKFDEHSIGRC